MKQLIAGTINDVARWYDHLRFEREVFTADLSGVDHSFYYRYVDPASADELVAPLEALEDAP